MRVVVATGKITPLSQPEMAEILHNCTYSILDEEILCVSHILLGGWEGRGRNEETPYCESVIMQTKP